MSADEQYNGWTNRETWAVALHINNDQGWQESVHEALREAAASWDDLNVSGGLTGAGEDAIAAGRAAVIIRENVEEALDCYETGTVTREQWGAIQDIGSMWRVNWTELGASFLEDLEDQ